MAEELDLSTTIEGSCAVVTVIGEIDLGTASELSDAAVGAMREVGPNLVLDLSGVTFMDSTGLKVLLAVHKRAELSGGRLVLAGATRSVDRIVKITGFDQTFVVCEDIEAAVAACHDTEPDPAAATD